MGKETSDTMTTRSKRQKDVADAEASMSEKATKLRRTSTPKEPRVWPVPDKAMFTMIKIKAGTAQKVEKQHTRILPWDQSFEEMVTMWENCTRFTQLAAKKGAWESSILIGLAEEGKNCHANTSLESEDDWEVWKTLFKKYASSTGKEWSFKVVWTFQAKRATEGSASDATSADSSTKSPIRTRKTAASTSTSGVTPTSKRSTVTARREASANDVQRSTSVIMAEIQQKHACKGCTRGYCYAPFPALKHCPISNAGVAQWAQAVIDGRTTIEKPHSGLREWIQWQKENLISATSHTMTSTPKVNSTSNMPPIYISLASPHAQGSGAPEYPQGHPKTSQIELASSPPREDGDPYDLLERWINYSILNHKECLGIDVNKVLDLCKADSMGYLGIRSILKHKTGEPWSELREYAINRGLAKAMHLELKRWEEDMREEAERAATGYIDDFQEQFD